MTWLAGKGYSHCGLYVHGVEYAKRDGSKLFGTCVLVLFEDLTDPILTGRDELGMPKLFADIDVEPSTDSAVVKLSWRGAAFGHMEISGLRKPDPQLNGTAHSDPSQPRPGPPPPPPDQGQFFYRYVPAVGEPGKADVEYPVFAPTPKPAEGAAVPRTMTTRTARVKFNAGDWQSLPTLHHVAQRMADMPIYGVEEAKLVEGVGVPDICNAYRIE